MDRKTVQRDAIRKALAEAARPLSPQEILAGAQAAVPRLGIATVYRTIKALVDEGWLVPVELPGEPARYELSEIDHHHHFHCRACGRVYDIEGCPGNLKALAPGGFEVHEHELVLYGRCPPCIAGETGASHDPRKAKVVHNH